MKPYPFIFAGLMLFTGTTFAVEKANPERIDEVRKLSHSVIPYDIDQTKQMFTKTVHGGVQHVVVQSAENIEQIKLIQAYLLKMTNNLSKGDFSVTEHIHGSNMPGLAQIKMAHQFDIKYEYKALPNGAQIHYSTEYPLLVQALHEWFDAQMTDHDNSVIEEHSTYHSTPAQ